MTRRPDGPAAWEDAMIRANLKPLLLAATLTVLVPLAASACPEKRTSDATPVAAPVTLNIG